ncbi:MAG: porin family protein [Bacteroidales bacterium]|nr:porin family protein [Bacteroidales bacterium]
MKMKLIFLVVIGMLTASMATAQSTEKGKTTFGLLGGLNLQNLNAKDASGDKMENDLIPGFHVGVNVQIPIAPEFYFQPGLLFSTKGAKHTGDSFTTTTNISYIEMPLNLVYKAMLGRGYVMLGFGPYLGYGIGGKVKVEGGPVTIENDIEFKNVVEPDDDMLTPYYKAFDMGANIFAGYEMANGIFVQLNSQFGFLKINPEDKRIADNKSSIKNVGFGLSLGYRF